MSFNHFKPKPGRFGVMVDLTASEKIGTITSAATDTFRIPGPFRKAFITRVSAQAQTPPVVTTGTSTATLKIFRVTTGTSTATLKIFRANGGSTVVVTSGLDLETLVANKAKPFVIPSTTTDAQRILQNDAVNGGDTMFVDVVNGTTIATQPVALFFVVELLFLE